MKTALITGGSGDIGAAICYKLAEQGLHVIVHSNSRLTKAETIAVKEDVSVTITISADVDDLNNDLKDFGDVIYADDFGAFDALNPHDTDKHPRLFLVKILLLLRLFYGISNTQFPHHPYAPLE